MTKLYKDETLSLQLEYLFNHSVNLKDRIITLAEDVSSAMFLKVDAAITELESYNGKAITIRLFSDGGEPDSAAAIVGRMKASKCKIIVEAYGSVASSATLILAAGSHRRISKLCSFMHHESSYAVGEKRHSEVKDRWKVEEMAEDRWAENMERFTKKPKSFWKTKGVRKDVYFTPEELVALGVADEVF